MRVAKWDYAKFFLIFCVVLGHTVARFAGQSAVLDSARFYVYLFHMPAFLFLAGLFSKKTVQNRRWDKAAPYLLLYALMEAMNYFVAVADKGVADANLVLSTEGGVPWYAFAMFAFYGLTMLWKDVHPGYMMTASILLGALVGYDPNIGSFLVLLRIFTFYPFFYLGYALDIARLQAFLNHIAVRITGWCIMIGSAVFVYCNFDRLSLFFKLFRGKFSYNEIWKEDWLCGGLWRLAAYGVSFLLIFSMLAIMPNTHTPIAALGSQTLSVFVYHYPILSLLSNCLNFRDWMVAQFPHAIAPAVLLFCLLLTLILSIPLLGWPIRKILKVPMRKQQASSDTTSAQ